MKRTARCLTGCTGQPSQTRVTLKMSKISLLQLMDVIMFAPGLVINAIALSWIISLERKGCKCGADWRRQYLKYWYAFAIAAPLLIVLLKDGKYFMPFAGLLGLASLIAFAAIVSFLWDIERRPCECAQDWREKLLLLTTILGVVGAVAGVTMARRQ